MSNTGVSEQPAERSELVPSLVSAAVYVAGAVAFALLAPTTRSLGLVDVLLVVAFAVLTRLEYKVGKGSAVPLQLAFVPMLFVMPLRDVPLAACAGSLLSTAIVLAQRQKPFLCPNAVGASWFAFPPAIVLLAAGEQSFSWRHWPIYIAAFCAQSLTDLVQAAGWERFVHRIRLREFGGALVTVYAFDALLTPIAMLAAAGPRFSFLALLPFTGVLHMLGRERQSRLDAQSEADRLHALAHVDDLTLVANRRSFDRQLAIEQSRARRSGSDLSVCLLDLDHFKQYNDRHGHPAGDDLLRRVSDAWAGMLRPEALLARIGGEEFGLILPDASLTDGEAVIERLRTATPHEITFSTGLACWNREETIADLIERVDAALYRAKKEGRDRLVLAA